MGLRIPLGHPAMPGVRAEAPFGNLVHRVSAILGAMKYEDAQLNGSRPSAAALKVLGALEVAGLEAWIVGGWVRDALRGAASHDIDMCCSGTWQASAAALERAGIGVVESGIKFGGITAIADGERFEVTTYRVDGFYTDGRHPEEVRFSERVEEDLARRDFTVNAMAWHPARGLLDLYDGEGDLARGLIRAVGHAQTRFEEDALRMLRAVRFACRLGFSVEGETARALAACAPLLDAIARERVGVELAGILATRAGGEAMRLYPEVICAAIPELAAGRGFDQRSPYHIYDVYEHTARVLSAASSLPGPDGADGAPSPSLMWAALLHDVSKPACFTLDKRGRGHFYGHPEAGAAVARAVMRRLGLAERLVRDACRLIRYHDEPLERDRESLLGMLRKLSGEGADAPRLMGELLDLKNADALGKAPACHGYVDEIERMRALVGELLEAGEAYDLKTLDLTGRDLIAAGVAPGKEIGRLLDAALTATIAGEVENARTALLAYLGLS